MKVRTHNCIDNVTPSRVSGGVKCFVGITIELLLVTLSTSMVYAYPEYQQYLESQLHRTKRTANCAMCHVHENGPVGNEPGQIGALSDEQMKRLSRARQAVEPGADVDSPILNQFGNEIIKELGKKRFVELRAEPAKLGKELSDKSDLDGDGIVDREEYMDVTDPLNQFHGDWAKLLFVNLDRNKHHIALAVVAIMTINYGLIQLIKGISVRQSIKKRET